MVPIGDVLAVTELAVTACKHIKEYVARARDFQGTLITLQAPVEAQLADLQALTIKLKTIPGDRDYADLRNLLGTAHAARLT